MQKKLILFSVVLLINIGENDQKLTSEKLYKQNSQLHKVQYKGKHLFSVK